MTERELEMLLMAYILENGGYERATQLSNYDRFKNWLVQGCGIAKSAVKSAWDWFKSLW